MFTHICALCNIEFKTNSRRDYYCKDCRKVYNQQYYVREKDAGREKSDLGTDIASTNGLNLF